ncbi:siderophore-interacting protein [Leucobacter massiliensis]|uniref:NADPH-dependent ferric siderophore reductase n=1 Tax=Leucobacter massiliensis TaxID=1686285 RepID=A0A2S9QLA2_9MICO|nr:siderophore-interacting protein [Leucobacter massiliensis]PRI10368.1 NADPH-dependent ferric siderophore reductase [Leucobacter massiliensis]
MSRPSTPAAPAAPAAAAAHPWEYSAFRVAVARTQRLSPGFVRVTLAGEELRHFAPWGLDQRIKLVLPMADGSRPDFGLLDRPTPHPKEWYARWKALPEDRRNPLRTYTPAAIRPALGEIDVELFIHEPAGPASSWALACAPGDELVLTGPDARVGFTGYGIHFMPPSPPSRLLLVGDESALPAIGNLLAAAPSGASEVLLELGDPADELLSLPLPRGGENGVAGTAHALRVVPRAGRDPDALELAVREWGEEHGAEFAADPGAYAWLAGEAGATMRIRRVMSAEWGLPKERIASLGYWKHGGPLVG